MGLCFLRPTDKCVDPRPICMKYLLIKSIFGLIATTAYCYAILFVYTGSTPYEYSKLPIFGLTQEWFRKLSFDLYARMSNPRQVTHFQRRLVGSFTSLA